MQIAADGQMPLDDMSMRCGLLGSRIRRFGSGMTFSRLERRQAAVQTGVQEANGGETPRDSRGVEAVAWRRGGGHQEHALVLTPEQPRTAWASVGVGERGSARDVESCTCRAE